MREDGPTRPRRLKAGLVAAIDVAVTIIYLLLITSQSGPQDVPRVAFTASYLVLLALLAIGGAVIAGHSRTVATSLLVASGVGNIALGAVGILSVGIPLLIAGLWMMIHADLRPRNRGPALGIILAPAAIMVVLLVIGLLSTS